MKLLVELMADFESGMVDKAAYVVNQLVSVPEGKSILVDEGGIPVLVEVVEVGSQRQREIFVLILLQVCEESAAYRSLVTREGAIPPWLLSRSPARRARSRR